MDANARAHRAAVAADLAALPEPPKKWKPAHDLALFRALLGGGLDEAIEATGYAASTCMTRLRRLLPGVMSRDAKEALLAELEARAREPEKDQ